MKRVTDNEIQSLLWHNFSRHQRRQGFEKGETTARKELQTSKTQTNFSSKEDTSNQNGVRFVLPERNPKLIWDSVRKH